jgi:hypothetical protein
MLLYAHAVTINDCCERISKAIVHSVTNTLQHYCEVLQHVCKQARMPGCCFTASQLLTVSTNTASCILLQSHRCYKRTNSFDKHRGTTLVSVLYLTVMVLHCALLTK